MNVSTMSAMPEVPATTPATMLPNEELDTLEVFDCAFAPVSVLPPPLAMVGDGERDAVMDSLADSEDVDDSLAPSDNELVGVGLMLGDADTRSICGDGVLVGVMDDVLEGVGSGSGDVYLSFTITELIQHPEPSNSKKRALS
jgi:hypothetical protein